SSYRVVVAATKGKTALKSHRWNLTPLYTTGVSAAPTSATVAWGEAVTVSGAVASSDRSARTISLQRRSGTAWQQVAKSTAAT
ncbi:hypothetical protein MWK22_24335, partial [Escherichia coli]|uniref:hypothetical protein n=1 Tax=Escherichia coli TaxID=562 RepID=UPI00201F0900